MGYQGIFHGIVMKYYSSYTLWCHQTWLAGKSPELDGCNIVLKIMEPHGQFSIAMFDYQRVPGRYLFTI